MTNPSPASSASSLPAFDSPPPTPSPVPTQSSSGPARTTTATTTTGKLHQQPTDTVYLKQELKQYVERKRGTLRIDVHGLRNLKVRQDEWGGQAGDECDCKPLYFLEPFNYTRN